MSSFRFLQTCASAFAFASLARTASLPSREPSAALAGPLTARASASSATFPLQLTQIGHYLANVTLGGTSYPVVMDTGSAVFWVYANVSNTQPTDLGVLPLAYGAGNISGPVLTAPLSWSGFEVPEQTFMQANDTSGLSTPPREDGWTGLVGLMPPIDLTPQDPSENPILNVPYTIFSQNITSAGNYITLRLGRPASSSDLTTNSTMTISTILSPYTDISNQPKNPLFPAPTTGPDPSQFWTILTDANSILGSDGQPVKLQSTVSTNNDTTKLAVGFDSGAPTCSVPKDLTEAIYGNIPEATLDLNNTGGWLLPCSSKPSVTFIFSGQKISLNPVDLVMEAQGLPSGQCIGTFIPASPGQTDPSMDMLLGVQFFRNVYMLLDYGTTIPSTDDSNGPFIQMLYVNATETTTSSSSSGGNSGSGGSTSGSVMTAPSFLGGLVIALCAAGLSIL